MKKLIFIFAISIFFSCTKEKIDFPITILDTQVKYRINDIYFLNQDIGFAVGGDRFSTGYILKTIDGGSTWQKLANDKIDLDEGEDVQTLNSIDFLNDSIGEIVGHGGKILRTTNGGNNWIVVVHGSWNNLYDIKMFSGNSSLIATGSAYETGSLFKSDAEWYHFDRTDYSYALRDLAFFDNSIGFALGYGHVKKTIDGGKTWKLVELEGDYFFNMKIVNNKTAYICGWEGGIYKTVDGGNSWKSIHSVNQIFSNRHHFENIDFITEDIGLVSDYNGNLLYTKNGGETWLQIDTKQAVDFHSLYFLNNKTAFVGGDNGLLIKIEF